MIVMKKRKWSDCIASISPGVIVNCTTPLRVQDGGDSISLWERDFREMNQDNRVKNSQAGEDIPFLDQVYFL